uniref:Uncharacterized protein n=1 Tax=Anopheles culicifacies TaxID=139723 RepID=A0A182LZ92_9DIPT
MVDEPGWMSLLATLGYRLPCLVVYEVKAQYHPPVPPGGRMAPGTKAGGLQPFGGSPDIGESVGMGRSQKKVAAHGRMLTMTTSSTISKVLLTGCRPPLQGISIFALARGWVWFRYVKHPCPLGMLLCRRNYAFRLNATVTWRTCTDSNLPNSASSCPRSDRIPSTTAL